MRSLFSLFFFTCNVLLDIFILPLICTTMGTLIIIVKLNSILYMYRDVQTFGLVGISKSMVAMSQGWIGIVLCGMLLFNSGVITYFTWYPEVWDTVWQHGLSSGRRQPFIVLSHTSAQYPNIQENKKKDIIWTSHLWLISQRWTSKSAGRKTTLSKLIQFTEQKKPNSWEKSRGIGSKYQNTFKQQAR